MTDPRQDVSLSGPSPIGGDDARFPSDFDGVLRRLSPSDQRLLRELAYKLAREGEPAPTTTTPVVTSYVPLWCTSLRLEGKSPGTIALYRGYVQELLQSYPSPGTSEIQAYLGGRLPVVGPNALASSVNAVKSFFKYLLRTKILESDPSAVISYPKTPRRQREIPPARDIALVLQVASENLRDSAIVLLLVGSGLRAGELVAIRRTDLDLAARRVTVIGKGGKQRTVPIRERAAAALERHIRTLPPGTPWLFPGRKGGHLSQQWLNIMFTELSARAGLVRPITPHHLRHYMASSLLNRNVPLKHVSELMGHSAPAVTANVYWHLLARDEHVRAYEECDALADIEAEERKLERVQLRMEFE